MAYQGVLTNPEGKTVAQGALLFVPVKDPDKYRLAVERIIKYAGRPPGFTPPGGRARPPETSISQ